jgi:hypothetical protein
MVDLGQKKVNLGLPFFIHYSFDLQLYSINTNNLS